MITKKGIAIIVKIARKEGKINKLNLYFIFFFSSILYKKGAKIIEAAGIFQKLYWGILYLEKEIKNKNKKNHNSITKSFFLKSLV